MTVRGIDNKHIHTGRGQGIHSVIRVESGTDGRTNTQRSAAVFTRHWEVFCFLKVLGGNHASQLEIVANDENLLDAVPMQQRHHFFIISAFGNSHKTVLWRHDRRYWRVQLGLEAKIAVRNDSHRLLAIDNRHTRNPHGAS